jgi:hypothetical protein
MRLNKGVWEDYIEKKDGIKWLMYKLAVRIVTHRTLILYTMTELTASHANTQANRKKNIWK